MGVHILISSIGTFTSHTQTEREHYLHLILLWSLQSTGSLVLLGLLDLWNQHIYIQSWGQISQEKEEGTNHVLPPAETLG